MFEHVTEELWLRRVLESSPDGLMVFRVPESRRSGVGEAVLEFCNAAASRWWCSAGTADPTGPAHLPAAAMRGPTAAASEQMLWRLVISVAETGRSQRLRVHQPPSRGGAVIDFTLSPMAPDHVVAACRDVSRLVDDECLLAAAYEETAEERATLRAALDATGDPFAVYDVLRDVVGGVAELRLVIMNTAGARTLGWADPADLTGVEIREIFPDVTSHDLWALVTEATSTLSIRDRRLRLVDGSGLLVAAWDATVAPAGTDRVVITVRDVTDDERRECALTQAKDDAHYAALHDPLTGLANRTLLHERLKDALRSVGPEGQLAVVYVDLDGFKQVNDTFGHAVGDDVLRAVAERLGSLVRSQDTAARLGGDEFVLLLPHLPPGWDEVRFVERARACLEQPVPAVTGTLRPRASFGITVHEHPVAVEEIMRDCDLAMYADKQARRCHRG